MKKEDRQKNNEIRSIIIDTLVDVEEAKLRALKRLQSEPDVSHRHKQVGRSQLDYVAAVLRQTGKELHIREIIEKIKIEFDIQLDRESLVSALTKRVLRNDRFIRTGKNVFALKGEE